MEDKSKIFKQSLVVPYEKSTSRLIYNYQISRYNNIIDEKNLIMKIIESCKDDDMKANYQKIYNELEQERKKLHQDVRSIEGVLEID